MGRPRRWRIALLSLISVLVVAGAWCAWQTYNVYRDLSAAADNANQLVAAVRSGETADAILTDLQTNSRAAADRTSGWTWSVLVHAPFLGDDARGIRTASGTMATLSTTGVEPLVSVTDDLKLLLPTDGKIPVDRLAALQAPVTQASAAFDRAEGQLGVEHPETFAEPLKLKYRELVRQVSDAAQALRTTSTAVGVLPTMLGSDGQQNYLLVFQNNAEIRATGGLPGAISLLQANDGAMTLSRQIAASSFGETAAPVLPLSAAEMKIYGEQLGTYFLDANFTPDFPRTSDLMKARWEQEYPEQIDGVLSIDPVALSYILDVLGPVDVGGFELTGENAVDELLSNVYSRYEDPADQDAFFRNVAAAVFARVLVGGASPEELLKALARGADEHRLSVHSFDADRQGALTGSSIAGDWMTTDPSALGVSMNDNTGSKMSFYLRYDVSAQSTYCTSDGKQGISATASLSSEAPENAGATLPDYVTGGGAYGIDAGSQLVAVRLFSTEGGEVGDVLINSLPLELEPIDEGGRQVLTLYVSLNPGQIIDITWRAMTAPGQSGATKVKVTPSIMPANSSLSLASSCS